VSLVSAKVKSYSLGLRLSLPCKFYWLASVILA